VAPTTRIESATGIQAMKPGSVVVSAGKKAWKIAPQNAALASPPRRTTPALGSVPGLVLTHSRHPSHAARIARPRSVKTTSGS
jgi:hypothetical protein